MKDTHKQAFIKLFQYLPPVFVILLTTHVAFLLHGINIPFTQYLVDSSFLGGSLLIASSILFDMCPLHKSCIWYTIIVTLLMDLQKAIGLGILLTPLRWIALIAGLFLCICIIIKWYKINHGGKCRR